jgi:hypothetical protein
MRGGGVLIPGFIADLLLVIVVIGAFLTAVVLVLWKLLNLSTNDYFADKHHRKKIVKSYGDQERHWRAGKIAIENLKPGASKTAILCQDCLRVASQGQDAEVELSNDWLPSGEGICVACHRRDGRKNIALVKRPVAAVSKTDSNRTGTIHAASCSKYTKRCDGHCSTCGVHWHEHEKA